MKRLKTTNKILIIICVILFAGLVFSFGMGNSSKDDFPGNKTEGNSENLGTLSYTLSSDRYYKIPLGGVAPSYAAPKNEGDIKEGDILTNKYREYEDLSEITITESEKTPTEKQKEFQKQKYNYITMHRQGKGTAAVKFRYDGKMPEGVTGYIAFYGNQKGKKYGEYEAVIMMEEKMYKITVSTVNGDALAMGEKIVSSFAKDNNGKYENLSDIE